MAIQTWLAFVAASTILLVIPGPTVLLVVSYALSRGWQSAFPMALGVALGDFTAMTFSLLGVGLLLATSASLFTALKWAGAAYLIWLGIRLWRAGGTLDAQPRSDRASARKMLGHAYVVTALNPKAITFFVAFLPQFLDPKGNLYAQMALCEATYIPLAFANAFGYGLLASQARSLVRNPKAVGIFNKAGGTLLIGGGIVTAAARAARD